MSNKQLVNFLEQQRVDVPDLQALQSSVVFDFQDLLVDFLGQTPYILQGYTIPIAAAFSNPASALQVVVASSVVWMPTDPNGAFLTTLPGTANEVLSPNNPKVTGSFAASSTNYLSVIFSRTTDPATSDLVSFWDVDSSQEFTSTVPRGIVLNYRFVISTDGFGTAAPIAIIVTDSANIPTSITNAKQELFRLGTGGASPNPNNSYTLTVDPENPLTSTSGSVDPFVGGDHQLVTWKNWMDLVMTRIKEISNSAYWYSDTSAPVPGVNLADLFFDTDGSVMTGAGRYAYDLNTVGLLSWSSNLNIRSIFGSLTLTVTAGSVLLAADGDVAYISIVRNQNFQPSNSFTFTSGSPTVTATAPVTGIAAGDFIKFNADNVAAWIEVQSVIGNTITLVSNYPNSRVGIAFRTQGTYTMQVGTPESIPVSSNTYWLAKRDDNAAPAATIVAPGSSGATRTSNVSTITTSSPHGLVAGSFVQISGVSDSSFDGNVEVQSTPTTTTFTYFQNGDDVGTGVAGNGTVNSLSRAYLRWIGAIGQGEDKAIDDGVSDETLEYIGAPSETASSPAYSAFSPGSLPLPSYNSNPGENLTSRLAKVTAMLADVNQNFNIFVDPGSVTWDGTTLTVTGAQLSIPGTTIGAAPVAINTYSAALPANSAVYVDINRTTAGTLTLAQATLSSLTPAQQQLIIASCVGTSLLVRP